MGRRTSGIGAAWFGVLGTALLVIASVDSPKALWRSPYTWLAVAAFAISGWLILRTRHRSKPKVTLGDQLECESMSWMQQLPGGFTSSSGEGVACRLRITNDPKGGWAEATVFQAKVALSLGDINVHKAQWMHEEAPWLGGSGRPPSPPSVGAGRRDLPADGDPQYLNVLQRHPDLGWLVQAADGFIHPVAEGTYQLRIELTAPGLKLEPKTYELVVTNDTASMKPSDR